MEDEEEYAFEFELKRPSLLATLLWGLGIATWALTVYAVLVGFVCNLNAMAIGFLIDTHSLEFKGVRIGLQRRKRGKKMG